MLLRLYEFLYKRINFLKKKKIFDSNYYSINAIGRFSFDFVLNQFNIHKGAVLNIGQQVTFREYCSVMIYNNAHLSIGENVFFNRYCSINCLSNIVIGQNTIFGEGVKLYDHNHKFGEEGKPIWEQGYKKGNITIGSNCWIGSNVTILNNVEIGNNVVIGAGCLIYKNIPSNCVVKSNLTHTIENIKTSNS
jgi:acetyltransferase-like isoleucine patch superfamily enzyme